jgi:general secretion pathway protein A
MSEVLAQYFGFRENPFGATPDPRCMYPSATHSEALASLKYGFLSKRGFIALIGPPGMGKTTLLFRFLEDIRGIARSVFLFDLSPQCQPNEVVGHILRDLGLVPGADSAAMHAQLNEVVIEEFQAGRSFVVVIDEAQNLSDSTLEMVRVLTNFETPQAKLMQVILAGQPQLSDKLMKPSLEQLRQRISTFCRLEPLSADQSRGYIDHRLKFAGYKGEPLFTPEALNQIVKAGRGVPRILNTLCFNALSMCYALQQKQVDERVVTEVIADQTLERPWHVRMGVTKARVLSVAALVVVSVLAGFLISEVAKPHLHDNGNVQVAQAPVLSAAVVATSHPTSDESLKPGAPTSVVVKRHESLQALMLQYLGEFNQDRVRQIMELNPGLTNPNHIEAGQTILLPPR